MAWALSELEGPHDALNRTGTPIDQQRLDRALDALRKALSDRAYLVADHFTVADLNTSAILMRPSYRKIAKADVAVGQWFERCTSRAAKFL